jgi:hypothetical protein
LLRLALGRKESKTKQWAGMMLASIGVSVWKHHDKLSKTNATYRKEKAKVGKLRVDMLFPTRIGKAVRRGLKTAERYRRTLLVLRAVLRRVSAGSEDHWKRIAKRKRIPERYFAAVDLPEFSVKSEPEWWKFLWPLIKKHLPKDSWYQRPPGYQPRKRYSSDFQKAAREHLQSLLRLRHEGILY